MVLLASVTIALALVALLLAYLQLGYHPAVAGPSADHAPAAERTMQRALLEAGDGIPANYSWGNRSAAVTEVRSRLAPTIESLNRSALERGTAMQVSLNASLASEWANASCPGGRGRDFGPCEADRGIVIQERAGETHVLAAGVEVLVVSQDAERRVWTVVQGR